MDLSYGKQRYAWVFTGTLSEPAKRKHLEPKIIEISSHLQIWTAYGLRWRNIASPLKYKQQRLDPPARFHKGIARYGYCRIAFQSIHRRSSPPLHLCLLQQRASYLWSHAVCIAKTNVHLRKYLSDKSASTHACRYQLKHELRKYYSTIFDQKSTWSTIKYPITAQRSRILA